MSLSAGGLQLALVPTQQHAPDCGLPAGVTAYQGAISAIMNETYLPIASGIEAVEVCTWQLPA